MSRKTLLRIIAVFMVITIGLTICGCGDQNVSDERGASSRQEVSSEEDDKKTAEQIVINFPSIWVANDSKAPAVAEIIDDFNEENSGAIKVVVEEIPDYQAYRDKMRTNVAAGNAPDVFTYDIGATSEFYFESGKLMDLTSYMEEGWKDDFSADFMDEVTYEGKIMAIPFELGVTPVLYNRRLFEEADIKEFPETYDELFEALDKLEKAGITPMSHMTGENAWTSMLWYSQIVAAIGGPDVYENGLDDPAFLEAAKIMKQMFNYTTSDAVGADASVSAGHFLNERTAIFMNGPWFIGRIKEEGVNDMYDYVEVAPAPAYEGGKGEPGGYIGYIQAYIACGIQEDEDKEEAIIKFVQHLTNPENVKKISLTSGSLFAVKTDIDSDDDMERLQKQMLEQAEEAPYFVPHFNDSVSPAVATEFPQALSSLVLGETTPEEFIETLKEADSI